MQDPQDRMSVGGTIGGNMRKVGTDLRECANMT